MYGHPDTTGIPNMDYFVTSNVEPESAQVNYASRIYAAKIFTSYIYYYLLYVYVYVYVG